MELSLHSDGSLRIKPLRALHSLRYDPVVFTDLSYVNKLNEINGNNDSDKVISGNQKITESPGYSYQIMITIDRNEAEGKRFGFNLFTEDDNDGLFFLIRPESRGVRLGDTEAPFDLSALPEGEVLYINIFVDKYLVAVFVNGRQAILQTFTDYSKGSGLRWYVFNGHMPFDSAAEAVDMVIPKIEI